MTYKHNFRAVLVAALIFQQVAFSADWSVTQTTSSSATSADLLQTNASVSRQAINGIVLDLDNDSVADSTQSFTSTDGDLSLVQTGPETNSSVQAVNLVSAQSLDNVTQLVSGFNTLEITHTSLSGGGNTQALNYASSVDNTSNLSQIVSGTSALLSSDAAGNIQALNFTQAASYNGSLEQSVTLDTFEVTNLGGGQTYVNSIQGDISGVTGAVIQNTNIGTVTVNPGSAYIMNHIAP